MPGRYALFGWGVILSLITAGAGSSYAGAVHLISQMIEAADPRVLWAAPALIGALGLIRAASLYGQTLATNRLALSIMRDLQSAMYARLAAADFARLQAEATGSLISRFTNDITMLRESLVRTANNLTRDLFMVILGIAWMVWIDWLLALYVLVVLPLVGQPVLKIGKAIRKRADAVQTQAGDVTSFLDESLAGARVVKSFTLENYVNARARARFAERFRLLMSMTRQRARIEPLMEVAGMIALAGVFVILGWRAVQGEAGISNLLGIVAAILVVSPAARALASLAGAVQEGFAVLDRVFALIDETDQVTEAPGARHLTLSGGAIRFEAVRFGYDGARPALDGVTLEARAGETVALVGPSGSGKTTLLNLAARLYDPDEGRVLIDGQDIRTASLPSVRGAAALVSQDITLFDDSVAANIALGRLDADREAVIEAARAADAHDFIMALPGGYDAPVGPKGSQLSGGQRQRIAIARAILKDAPILLLDEATSALDAEAESRVQAALERLAEGRTTLVIAHRLSTVRKADRIYVLDQGRIAEQGDHASLSAAGGLYARLSALQLREE
ncbi:ABC transporter ATP-binding protein [Alkalicaulis satelles]|uniref:ABC transporter ATP-binding protein n=1 Tax=Alkalicaulis satelles TaxID=2609175 RepID=A0A5M6ZHZ7_9PROT|nr:ABC transporter ATP-binding protein [Alkalicaulis satelles]KAA5803715.1 ABC transporter ATP-binding protein [Alkalicaulis satelles]